MANKKLEIMTLEQIFTDKTIKAKAKVKQIGEWLLEGTLPIDELLAFSEKQTKPIKGSCIESIEYATKKQPEIADEAVFLFVTNALKEDEPRIKWESAKVIGNIAKLFPSDLSNTINNLLVNAKSDGTVVRWASALALGEILKLKLKYNATLLPKVEKLSDAEEDNGVKNKYLGALKKIKK
ncbi:hypothetical protein [uncultured Eudoraea sp.]|uniref:hypothetical protein n=1 Tax=uncultured Eudoraea sp. TaxID=1035614 RepID=UPI002622C236|nr:hypothetical protein [uncultured Eudoraea sp.]